jgi:dTDP-alpha-D-glucose dehydrogenase
MDGLLSRIVGGSPKTAIVGAGYVGLSTAIQVVDAYGSATLLDVDRARVEMIQRGEAPISEPKISDMLASYAHDGRITATTEYSDIADHDVFIVCVNTPVLDSFRINASYLADACRRLSKLLSGGKLVIVRSTIEPRTMRDLVLPALAESSAQIGADYAVCMCPERLSEGNAYNDMKNNPIIIGSNNPLSSRIADAYWRPIYEDRIIHVSMEEAELAKLADNLWIDVNIALANELALVSEKVGADARNVIRAANTLKKGSSYVNILTPGIGVGGSCLPKDPYILGEFAKTRDLKLQLPYTSRRINDSMPQHTFDIVQQRFGKVEGLRVLMLGLSFNADSGDVRSTPTLPLIKTLLAAGAAVTGFDPLVRPHDLGVFHDITVVKTEEELRSLLPTFDCIVVADRHQCFQGLRTPISQLPRAFVVDGRYFLSNEEGALLGDRYVAIGVGRV